MGYGGIIGQQFDGYTQNQTLTQAVAALYGLGTDAVPNDVFNILSQSALYKAVSTKQQIGNLPVGTTIYLNENGSPVPYLIVNQGIPQNSNLYDSSCDGTWVLRQDIYSSKKWNNSNINSYATSTVNTTYLPSLLNLYDSDIQSAIKQVKIPYVNGTGNSAVASGANGLSCKIFLLSGYEVGWTQSDNQYFPNDGAKLSYFESGTDTSANNKRIAKLNGSVTDWWLRSPYTDNTRFAWRVGSDGFYNSNDCTNSYGIRPAFILPSTFMYTLPTIPGLYDTQDNLIMSIPSMGFSPASVVTGSYVGTGTYGESNPTTINFINKPIIVFMIIKDNNMYTMPSVFVRPMLSGALEATAFPTEGITSVGFYGCGVVWGEKSVGFYSNNAFNQFNSSASAYSYFYAAICE